MPGRGPGERLSQREEDLRISRGEPGRALEMVDRRFKLERAEQLGPAEQPERLRRRRIQPPPLLTELPRAIARE